MRGMMISTEKESSKRNFQLLRPAPARCGPGRLIDRVTVAAAAAGRP